MDFTGLQIPGYDSGHAIQIGNGVFPAIKPERGSLVFGIWAVTLVTAVRNDRSDVPIEVNLIGGMEKRNKKQDGRTEGGFCEHLEKRVEAGCRNFAESASRLGVRLSGLALPFEGAMAVRILYSLSGANLTESSCFSRLSSKERL